MPMQYALVGPGQREEADPGNVHPPPWLYATDGIDPGCRTEERGQRSVASMWGGTRAAHIMFGDQTPWYSGGVPSHQVARRAGIKDLRSGSSGTRSRPVDADRPPSCWERRHGRRLPGA